MSGDCKILLNCCYRSLFLAVGWSAFAYLAYKVTTAKIENKVYNPFEILEISTVRTQKSYDLVCLMLNLHQGYQHKRYQITL